MNRFYLFSLAAAATLSAAAAPQRSLLKHQADVAGMKPLLSRSVARSHKVAPAKESDAVEWSDWEMAGTGTFVLDSGFEDYVGMPEWTGEFPDVNVYSRTDANDANSMQYKLEGVYNNVDLIIDYDVASGFCRVAPQPTGIEYPGASEIYVVDFATCYEIFGAEWAGMSEDEVREVADYYAQYNYYVPELGRFYLFLGYYIEEIDDLINMTDVRFQLDGVEDMSVSVEAQAFYNEDSTMKGLVKFGDSVAYCNYGCFSGIIDNDKINAVVSGADGVHTITSSSEVELINSDGNGMYSLVAVTFSADGTPLEWDYAEYTYSSSSHEGWTLLGKGTYTSDMFESLFGLEEVACEVDVERNDLNPGLIRIVNPYGPSSPYYSDPDVSCEKDYDVYLVFDASDPDRVFFKPTNLGIDFGGGWWIAMSTAYFIEEFQGATASGSIFGSLADNVISFPERGVVTTCENIDVFGATAGMWYYGNYSGALSLVLPVSTEVEAIGVEPNASSEFFNMQGIRISEPANGSMVIERKGTSINKKVIR